ncbi:MAG: hypothetical protein ACJA2S_002019 [Cyclobacteriaceae bacterium]|jgi:hypothetical protein
MRTPFIKTLGHKQKRIEEISIHIDVNLIDSCISKIWKVNLYANLK